MELLNLLQYVTEQLEAVEIPYMISGSIAMNIYTVPRMTRDIDIVVALYNDKIDSMAGIFEDGFYISKDHIPEELKRQGMFNVIDFKSGQKIDFIIRKSTPFHLEEFSRRNKSDFYGFDMWVTTIEDLIISKLIWIQQLQSDTQLRDINNLKNSVEVDKDYINKWVKEMKLNTFNLW
jgi:hypothetical protein